MEIRAFSMMASVLLALALGACAAAPEPGTAAPPSTAPVAGDPLRLDRSCASDADCEVKNVGNCCGYYPACVNRAARPDPEAVRARCAESAMSSICGFQEISACSCVANRCEAVQHSLGAPLE